jgi:hypothetical protein
VLFNFSDTCFGWFFDAGDRITNGSTGFGLRLGLSARVAQKQALRFHLISAGLNAAQARIGVRSAEAAQLALRLGLSDITPCAWRLIITARPLSAHSFRAAIGGGQGSRFQTILRIRVIERFTN